MAGYLCNLIIPGAGKSGTTSLHYLMAQHPDICMSIPKEPQHFSFDDLYSGGPEAHNALFDHCRGARYYGESSQSYFVHEHAVERIHKKLNRPKIILILRDPLERLLSHYAWRFKVGAERSGLMEAVRERGWVTSYESLPEIGMYQELGAYLAGSHYSKYVPLWVNTFGSENVLVLTTDEMKTSQPWLMERCFDFLGLPPINVTNIEPLNTTEGTVITEWPAHVAAIVRLLPAGLKKWMNTKKQYRHLRKAIAQRYSPKPDLRLNEDDFHFLRETLAEDIAFYERLTKKASRAF